MRKAYESESNLPGRVLSARVDNQILRMQNCSTGRMGTRQIGEHLAKQREKGWPGSTSIHGKPLTKKQNREFQSE